MLSPQERSALDEIRAHYRDARAASVSVMRWLQQHRGWLSDETMADAADYLRLPVADVEALATFYNLLFRRPVGEKVILLCDSVSCWMRGYARIRAHLEERLGVPLGETTVDGRYTLLPVVCLGDCDHAPVMLIGDRLHQGLTPERIDQILAEDESSSVAAAGPPGGAAGRRAGHGAGTAEPAGGAPEMTGSNGGGGDGRG